jgi:mono/diheme cytochrome c family protein
LCDGGVCDSTGPMSWKRKLAISAGAVVGVAVLGVGGLLGFGAATYGKRLSFPGTPAPDLHASTDPAVIDRGRYLVHGPAHCAQCHGSDDRAHPEKSTPDHPLSGGLAFDMGPIGVTYASNLTPDPTGIGPRTDAELARAVRTGVLHDGRLSVFMRYSASALSDDDLVAVLSYLRAQKPVARAVPRGEVRLLGKALLPFARLAPATEPPPVGVAPSAEPSVARGAYVAEHVARCVGCHSQVDPATFLPTGPKAGGGDPDPSHGDDADMEFVSPNLTSDPTGLTGKWPEDAFVARLRGGRVHRSSIMPWEQVARMTEADMRSVYRYLRSLPPVSRDVGATYRKQGAKG